MSRGEKLTGRKMGKTDQINASKWSQIQIAKELRRSKIVVLQYLQDIGSNKSLFNLELQNLLGIKTIKNIKSCK